MYSEILRHSLYFQHSAIIFKHGPQVRWNRHTIFLSPYLEFWNYPFPTKHRLCYLLAYAHLYCIFHFVFGFNASNWV